MEGTRGREGRSAHPAEGTGGLLCGLAVLFTVLWPGAGHLYLGFTQKAIPYVVANVIAFLLAFTVILLPITLVIYVVTLCLAIKTVSEDTEAVNRSDEDRQALVALVPAAMRRLTHEEGSY